MKKRVLIGALAAIAISAAVYWAIGRNSSETLATSGTVEAWNIRVGSKVGGRVEEVRVREGDVVQPGQVLVTFEEQELLAALEQARAELTKLQRGYRPEEIAQARADAAQALAEYEQMQHGYRPEEIAGAAAEAERARAEAERTEAAWVRARDLANAQVFSQQQRDDAEGQWKAASAALVTAQERLTELQRGYRPEQVAAAKARFEAADAVRRQYESGYRVEDIAQARAALSDAEARYRERQVLAPAAATVEVLDVRPGDLIAPNVPIATLLERDQLYIRVYVPETQIGLVKVGQSAEVRVNSFPDEVFRAVVEQINQKAEFLPRNVQTREERVHQVFGVRLRIQDPQGRIRAGMAADVSLALNQEQAALP
jgi:multidrug resistance efflux pump